MLLRKQYFQDSYIQNSNGVLKATCENQIPFARLSDKNLYTRSLNVCLENNAFCESA